MAGRLQQFVQKTKNKKEEEAQRQKEVLEHALSMVPRCELNEDLPDDAAPKQLWKAIQAKFQWNFGPSKGKSLKDTKSQFLKWAMRKLKEPVRSICHIELMMREKQMISLPEPKPENETAAELATTESQPNQPHEEPDS